MYSASNKLVKSRNNIVTANSHYYRNVYLQSNHWKELRAEKLNRSAICEQCGRKDNLDVHHVNYRGLYDVKLSDLKTLCRICHEKEHIKKKKKHKRAKRLTKEQFYMKSLWFIFHNSNPNIHLINWILQRILKFKYKVLYLNDRNKERQKTFDKKYKNLNSDNNTYVSIHY